MRRRCPLSGDRAYCYAWSRVPVRPPSSAPCWTTSTACALPSRNTKAARRSALPIAMPLCGGLRPVTSASLTARRTHACASGPTDGPTCPSDAALHRTSCRLPSDSWLVPGAGSGRDFACLGGSAGASNRAGRHRVDTSDCERVRAARRQSKPVAVVQRHGIRARDAPCDDGAPGADGIGATRAPPGDGVTLGTMAKALKATR